ncbi:MAG: hypothetical protein LBS03_11055, partial [Bacteroidales bacterium]|nr:hypothetical protein [Bacteroidales bacterium]
LTALFHASVGVKTISPGTVELTNNSSLPVSVSLGGATVDLSKDCSTQVYRATGVKKITVPNWMVGMNASLEVEIND